MENKNESLVEPTEERKEEMKDVKKQLTNLMEEDTVRKLIDKNEIEFDYKEEKYRIRKPTYSERQTVYERRCEKQVELLRERHKDGSFKYLSESDLKNLYRERGIDVDKMLKQITTLKGEEKDLMFKLGELLKNDGPKKQAELYRKDIEITRDKMSTLTMERTGLLEFAIEHQVLIYVYSYYTILVTEKKEEDKWVRVWSSVEEMSKGEAELVTQATTYTAVIINDQITS